MSAHLRTLARRLSPDVIPVFPLRGTILLPGCELPLNIFEPRYLNMIEDSLKADRLIGMVQNAVDPSRHAPHAKDAKPLAPIGGLGRIKQFSESDDGRYLIVLSGLKRFEILGDAAGTTPYRRAKVTYDNFAHDIDAHISPTLPKALSEDAQARSKMTAAMKSFARAIGVEVDWDALGAVPMNSLVDQASMISPFDAFDKQSLIEAPDHDARRRLLVGLMTMYAKTSGGRGEDKTPPSADLQ